jgi:hypothetical protein
MAASTCIDWSSAVGREIVKLFCGALLSPLVIIVALPLASFVEAHFGYSDFDLGFAMRMCIPVLFFTYLGMLMFAIPMYLVLRAARSNLWLSILIACIAGFFAPLIIPDLMLLFDSPRAAFQNFRVLFTVSFILSLWLNSITVTGAAVGAAFLFIARPGPPLLVAQSA